MRDYISFVDLLRSRHWSFGSVSQGPFLHNLKFRSGGRVSGYAHPNESGWRIHNDALEFIDLNIASKSQQTAAHSGCSFHSHSAVLSWALLLRLL